MSVRAFFYQLQGSKVQGSGFDLNLRILKLITLNPEPLNPEPMKLCFIEKFDNCSIII